MAPTEPDLPRDPAEYRPRPLLGASFWALIAFGVLCVLAGAGVALLAPRLFPPREAPAAPAPPVAPTPSASASTPRPVRIEPETPPAAGEVARLNARIAALESEGARSSEAAAAALAVAELVDATRGSGPFANELASLRAAAPDLPELAALGRLAEIGAPSRAELAVSFPEVAAQAARRARKPGPDARLGDRLAYAATRIVIVRRIDDLSGDSPDALLARAQAALDEGNVTEALKLIDRLPERSHKALAGWRAGAERRAEIDRQAAALRARALRDLAPVITAEAAT